MSKLAISSLLCDDDKAVKPSPVTEPQIVPEPVVLAPHLRKSPQRVDTESHSRNQYPNSTSSAPTRLPPSISTSPPLVSSPTSSRLALDALVHAASEEQRRLSVSGPSSTNTVQGSPYQPAALATRNPSEDPYTQYHGQYPPNLSPLHELKLRTTNPISPLLTQQQQQRRNHPFDDAGPVHLSPVEDLTRRAGPSRSPYTFPSPLPPTSYRPSSSHSSPSVHHASPSYHHLSPATEQPRDRSRDREREQIREREIHEQELLQYQQRPQRHQQQFMLVQQEQRQVHRDRILGYGPAGESRTAQRIDADRSAPQPPLLDHRDRHGRKSDPLPGPGMRSILSPTVHNHVTSSLSGPGIASSPSAYTNYMPLPTPTRSSPHLQPVQSPHTSRPSTSSSFFQADWDQPALDRGGDERSSKKRRHSDTSPMRNEETRTGEIGIGRGKDFEEERGRERDWEIKKSGERDRLYERNREREMELLRREREREELEHVRREQEREREELEHMRREQERAAKRGFGGVGYPGPSPSSSAIASPRPTSIAAITSPSIPVITSPTTRRAGAGYDPVHELDRVPPPHNQEHARKRSHEFASTSELVERDMQRFGGAVAMLGGHGQGLERHEFAGVRTQDYPTQQQPLRTSQPSFHNNVNDRDPVHSAHRDSQAFLQLQIQPEPSRRHSHHVEREQQPQSPQLPRIPHLPNIPHQHRVVSPISIGRRSPPGSQVGRAIAARKVELEHHHQQMSNVESSSHVGVKVEPSTSPAMDRPTFSVPSPSPSQPSEQIPPKAPEGKVKSDFPDRKRSQTIVTEVSAEQETKLHIDGGLPVKPEKTMLVPRESPSAAVSQQHPKSMASTSAPTPHFPRMHPTPQTKPVHVSQRPPSRAQSQAKPQRDENEDAHEWFLEHYADETSESRSQPQPKQSHPSSADSVARNSPVRAVAQSDPVRLSTKSPTPHSHVPREPSPVEREASVNEDNDAVMALEKELELGLAEVSAEYRKKEALEDVMDVDDADVDQAVSELMEEALGTGRREDEDVGSEVDRNESAVDVEDELLSLLDDQPHSSANDGSKHHPHANHTQSSSLSGPKSSKSSKPKPTVERRSPPKLSSLKLKNESGSQPASPLAAGPSGKSATRSPSVSLGASAARASSVRPQEKDDRESMPPPATPNKEKGEIATSAQQPKKKGKPGPKPKQRSSDSTVVGAPPPAPPKARGKPGPKPKPRDEFGNIIRAPAAAPAKASKSSASATPTPQPSRNPSGSVSMAGGSGARSRSTSVLPGGSVGPEGDAGAKDGEDEQEMEDDKLYCVCKTQYDEDRAMIACDSCDEWYHTQCMDVQDHLVDLVDQFFCPLCIEKNPTRNFQTTYKPRCLHGLESPDPDSPKACHKPARAFSKYCSDACGVKNMRKRIDAFTKKGGKKDDLWEAVKDATAREGIVKCVEELDLMDVDGTGRAYVKPVIKEVKPVKAKKTREIERLNSLLGGIEKLRDELKRDMDIILWREKLLQLASDRAESVGQCGWDQRLCFSDEDWADYGEGVLESYADIGEGEMDADGEGEWWCPGEQECERHAGWQGLRAKDVDKEKEKKEEALMKLTTREREIRKRLDSIMEDAGPLPGKGRSQAAPPALSKPNNKLTNGHNPKSKVNGDAAKKGKKRKAPS